MSISFKGITLRVLVIVSLLLSISGLAGFRFVAALGSTQNPQSGSSGLSGTVPGNPPTQAATIAIPSNNQTFTSTPINVSGLCQTGLLIKIFSNNVFVGSTTCVNNSYSLQVDLFEGLNNLVAIDYNNLDQQGPDSNTASVTFNDAQFAQYGTRVTLSSNYARIGANPGSVLTWPIILSGGVGPYALSVDWGDGGSTTLKSIATAGDINLTHTYNQAGVYNIIFKATDANNTSAFLQVVGVANGKINGALSATTSGTNGTTSSSTIILWQPLLIFIPMILAAFWLGRRHELYEIRKRIEASRQQLQ